MHLVQGSKIVRNQPLRPIGADHSFLVLPNASLISLIQRVLVSQEILTNNERIDPFKFLTQSKRWETFGP